MRTEPAALSAKLHINPGISLQVASWRTGMSMFAVGSVQALYKAGSKPRQDVHRELWAA